jgi:cystathionine beta-lyase/cystathionine gamma-synthase
MSPLSIPIVRDALYWHHRPYFFSFVEGWCMAIARNGRGKLRIETAAVHAGEFVDPVTRSSSPNIVMSATFAPAALTGFSARDEMDYDGFVYARVGSPTVRQLEQKLAALENGEAALCFASGIAASHALIAGRLSAGDHVVFPESNYVGVAELARDTLPRFGIEAGFADMTDTAAISAAIRPSTRMLWLETPCNPTMQIADIAGLAKLAHGSGVRDVVVDSTFATPLATLPLELGADFVVHSLTKYIGGHGDAMGGCVIGRKADLDALNLEATVHYGGILSPFNAWLIMRGAATLPIRMKAHEDQALAVARWLEGHKAVKRVLYPGLMSHPQHELVKKQMKNFSGMLTFQTHGNGPEIAKRMVEKLEYVHYAVSLGHHRSLICWIGTSDIEKSSFRHDAAAAQRFRALMGEGVFRLSVGIEHADDICADLSRCLD